MSQGEAPGADPSAPRLRPMGVGAVLEVSTRILRRHFALVLVLALLLIGPVALLTAATSVRFNEVLLDVLPISDDGTIEAGPIDLTRSQVERLGGAIVGFLLASAFAGVLATIAGLGFSAVVGADYHARAIDLRSALASCLRGALSLLGVIIVTTVIVVGIITAGGAVAVAALAAFSSFDLGRGGPGVFLALLATVAMVLVVVYLTMRWAMAVPAIALERVGARAAIVRSWHLTGDNVWRTFLVIVMATLVTAILSALVAQVLAIVVVDVLAVQLGLDLVIAETVVVATASVLLAPVSPVVVAVLFHDLKVRRDSWEP